jgi:hypothetical protein
MNALSEDEAGEAKKKQQRRGDTLFAVNKTIRFVFIGSIFTQHSPL